MTTRVWVVLIDLGNGVKEPVHSFDNPEAAEAYRGWAEERNGETCYVAELPVESTWGTEAFKEIAA